MFLEYGVQRLGEGIQLDATTEKCYERYSYYAGSSKTLGTILRDPIVASSVGQVGLSGYLAFF